MASASGDMNVVTAVDEICCRLLHMYDTIELRSTLSIPLHRLCQDSSARRIFVITESRSLHSLLRCHSRKLSRIDLRQMPSNHSIAQTVRRLIGNETDARTQSLRLVSARLFHRYSGRHQGTTQHLSTPVFLRKSRTPVQGRSMARTKVEMAIKHNEAERKIQADDVFFG